MPRNRSILPLLLVLALSLPGEAAEPPADSPPSRTDGVEAVLGAALGNSSLEEDVRFLCDRIGGRPTGSAAMERAVDWAVERFEAAGVDRVVAERFEMPLRWNEGKTSLTVLAPEPFAVRAVSAAWSPATPAGGIEAPVRDLGAGSEDDWARLADDAEGAILLVRREEMHDLGDLFAEYMQNIPLLQRARERKAAAVLFQSTRPRGLLYRHQLSFDGVAPLPVAIASREGAARIARLIEAGETVRARLDLPNEIGPSFDARNVVADVRGREKPEEMVLLGAHLDSWGLGTGALDNGANSAMVIDVARALVASGRRPRRTVRLVLFSGEEQGLVGSAAYVRQHRDELDGISAVVIYDLGVARVRGYFLGGRPELAEPLARALAPLASWGVTSFSPDAFAGTDHFDFLLQGVPNLVADQDPAPYLADYHAESDTFDKVDLRELRVQTAVAAVTVWSLAELPERLGARLDARGVADLVGEPGLRREMEVFGIWEPYVQGRRGLRPPHGAFEAP